MPLGFIEAGLDADDPLRRLLPITEPRAVGRPEGFGVTLTADGRLAAFLQMEPTPEASDRRWAQLPKHYWAVVGKAKPGVTVLATVGEASGVALAPREEPK